MEKLKQKKFLIFSSILVLILISFLLALGFYFFKITPKSTKQIPSETKPIPGPTKQIPSETKPIPGPTKPITSEKDFKYRKPITINNTKNSNTLTDYQVLITLDTQSLISQGKMRSDCGDIKFIDSDGTTSLNYWLESGCNSSNTRVWVKVPSIPAKSTKTIYLYYGNQNAASQSNGTSTFLAFDLKFDGPIGGRSSFSGFHTCALLSDSTAKCWGNNEAGQLGDGTTSTRSTPVSVSGLSKAIAIAAGWNHTCALLNNGTVKCWGHNDHGQLGDGTTANKRTPVSVLGLSNAVAIAAGGAHTCALLSDGTVRCWGRNYYGQLGDGTNDDKITPVSVLNYNLGGRYDKTGGIPATIQRPPYFQDTYFIRKYTSPEPTTSVGAKELLQ
jgi:hypothetical protein